MTQTPLLKNVPTRCCICRMHLNLCVCNLLFKAKLQTKVIILMHYHEHSITTNTAHLIPKILPNAEIRYRGKAINNRLVTDDLKDLPGSPLLLFPLSGAKIINEEYLKTLTRPITLIVPDGNWRQTAKMVKKEPNLLALPKIVLPEAAPSQYRLRTGPTGHHLCTYEAIARTLGIIEGAELQQKMEYVFNVMVERVLWTRGKLPEHEVTGWF